MTAAFKVEVLAMVDMACEDALAKWPGDANRDARMTAVMQVVASLYEAEQREFAVAVAAEEIRVEVPRAKLVVKDFVRGDTLVE